MKESNGSKTGASQKKKQANKNQNKCTWRRRRRKKSERGMENNNNESLSYLFLNAFRSFLLHHFIRRQYHVTCIHKQ